MMSDTTGLTHVPVLLAETLDGLALSSGDMVVDCTVGGGAHAEKILERTAPDGQLLGIDQDAVALEKARARLDRFEGRCRLVHDNFRHLDSILDREKVQHVDGVLMDLGVSSFQLDDPSRGFSFQGSGPLDMRMDSGQKENAADIVQTWSVEDLARIFREFGEVAHAGSVARSIVRARSKAPLRDTQGLARVVEKVMGKKRKKIHPATQVFQALRIALNDELGALREALPKAVACLRDQGRLCVISFHSLEDKLVKRFFRRQSQKCICPAGFPVCRCDAMPVLQCVGRKAIRPSASEVQANPRCRSAKMRVAEKICSAPLRNWD